MGCSSSKPDESPATPTKTNADNDADADPPLSPEEKEEAKDAFDEGDSVGKGKKLYRTGSMMANKDRMKRTKSAVYEEGAQSMEETQDAVTRRTSGSQINKGSGSTSSQEAGVGIPSIVVGMHSHVGDPSVHANEDRATAVLDLLRKFAGKEDEYSGDDEKWCAFFGVYDGHGGDTTSEYLKNHLHVRYAQNLWKNNTAASIPDVYRKTFHEVDHECDNYEAGSCCTTVFLKDNTVWCGNAGDSKAVLVTVEPKNLKKKIGDVITLNDRHGIEFSEKEIARVNKAGAEVSEEGAVIARDRYGNFMKGLFPTRGFGDADFVKLVKPKPVVIADPTGRGLDYEGDVVKLNTEKTTFLLVGCDGLWDFMTEAQIISKLLSLADKSPQVMAQEMVKTAQGRPYESYDDVTVIIAKIDYN